MTRVQEIPVPPASLLGEVLAQSQIFADAYAVEIAQPVALSDVIAAFYNSSAFWPERTMINLFTRRSMSDAALAAMIDGTEARFGLWRVTQRRASEIYLRDQSGRTASWLAVDGTTVMFGSAVYPSRIQNGEAKMGAMFWALLGFHRFYSKALLGAAVKRL